MDTPEPNRNSVDMVQWIGILLKRKWLIILGTLGITLLAFAISFLLPKTYRSEGFLQLSGSSFEFNSQSISDKNDNLADNPHDTADQQGVQKKELLNEILIMNELLLMNQVMEEGGIMSRSMTLSDYKKYYPRFTNSHLLKRYIQTMKPNAGSLIPKVPVIEPVYAYTKKDLNDMGQISKSAPNFVVGIKIRCEQPEPENARILALTVGDYIKDTILFHKLNEYILAHIVKTRTAINACENAILRDESVPGKSRVTTETIPSTKEKVENNLDLNHWNLSIQESRYKFFSKALDIVKDEKFGENLLHRLIQLNDTFFTDPNYSKIPAGIIRQVKIDLENDFDNLRNINRSVFFISEPAAPSAPAKPNKMLITAIAFLISFIGFLCLAFLLEWWKTNKDKLKQS